MSAFRGRLPARALVIDVPLIGEAEARRRVVETWRPGATLFDLPGGAWLLEFVQAVTVRTELAPGLVLVDSGGVLHPSGTPVEGAQAGDLLIPRAGATTRVSRTTLTPVDRESWIDLAALRIEPLAALDRPVVAAPAPEPWQPPPPAPDLRAMAGIASPPKRTRRLLSASTRPSRRRRLPDTFGAKIAAIGAAVLVYGVAALVAAPFPMLVVGAGAGLLYGINKMIASSTAASADGGAPPTGRSTSSGGWWNALIARLVLASRAARLAVSVQHRYVRRLSAAFERRDWDKALREAIAVSGSLGRPTLRLPRPRTGDLVPHPHLEGGPALPLDSGAQQHLRTLYRQAATELDRAGRTEESAFILADLLGLPVEAVALLERHGKYRLAAGLAEGRELDPDLTVRLWWQAGDRDRAVQVARVRGAFAGAVERLARVDGAAARQLRAEWVRGRQAADDHLGAVEAAWPDDELRPLVVPNIQAGMALSGHTAGYLFAHLATWRPTTNTVTAAIALLAGRDRELVQAQRGFLAALAELQCADRARDRQLCTAALRLMVRSAADEPVADASERRRIAGRLRHRADRLAAADLPPLPVGRAPAPSTRLDITAASEAGQLPIHDAVLLSGRTILTAHGEFGVRLIGLDGRTRASWDAPAHQLVVADHGANVLLVARRGHSCEVRGLNLSTRRLRPPVAITAERVLPSYDGALLTVVDDDGIAFVDLTGDSPRITWRELDSSTTVLDIARSPTSLAALVRISDQPGLGAARTEVWRWDLPSIMLRTRRTVDLDGLASVAVLASSTLVTTSHDEHTGTYHVTGHGTADWTLDTEPTLLAGGEVSALRMARPDDTTVDIADGDLRIVFPPGVGPIGIRRHVDTLTTWEQDGRLVVVDLTLGEAVARLRTRL
ncbi:bpX6 domain-containing protein [Micromonospora sp. CPCC 205539]|uniref:bpX6 domain-containing protein n=1 Tax=Micromonospora sp. CPCC 205539 TaxID=3122408 RepID=UPI002FF16941